MSVLERLKNSLNICEARTVDISKALDGAKPDDTKEFSAVYKKNVGNIVHFNEGVYGDCLVLQYKDEANHVFAYKEGTNKYLLDIVIGGKTTEVIIPNTMLQEFKKLKY